MSYLQCRRCGLQIKIQATILRVENCPRCMARSATASPLVESAHWTSPAARWASGRDERRNEIHTLRDRGR